MKELNWKHILLTTALIVLFWPFIATAYLVVLGFIPWINLDSIYIGICLLLSVVTLALVINMIAPSSEKKVLHGLLAAVIAAPIIWFLALAALNYLSSSPD